MAWQCRSQRAAFFECALSALAGNQIANRAGQPDKWYAAYWFKHAPLVKVRNHRRTLLKRWARIEAGELRYQSNGVVEPKPAAGRILRIRRFR